MATSENKTLATLLDVPCREIVALIAVLQSSDLDEATRRLVIDLTDSVASLIITCQKVLEKVSTVLDDARLEYISLEFDRDALLQENRNQGD